MRILVVEDDYITAEVIKEILSDYGEVSLAENGYLGLQSFKAAFVTDKRYDLILLDIMMPEMDGLETLNKIREEEELSGVKGLDRVKIVMVTALDDFNNIKTAFHNQAESYVVKPIDKNKILKALTDTGFIV